ncbi:MAG: hypothetical protein ABEH43_00150, partial [Flavobacteriales bacterium]
TAMPWSHYNTAPSTYMRDEVVVDQVNLNQNNGKLITNSFQIREGDTTTFDTTKSITPSVSPGTKFSTTHFIKSDYNYVFDASKIDSVKQFEVLFLHNTTPDENRNNDTIRFTQKFDHSYAYDNGTAEAGYSVLGRNVKIAYGFNLQKADTLRGLKMYFNPMFKNPSDESFLLTVWKGGNKPGEIIHKNVNFHTPEYRKD